MADSKNCEMEASERSRSIKETEENVTITHGDELMNANLHVANQSEKTIPSNEDVDIHSELSAPSVRSRTLTVKGQEERIRHLNTEQVTALKAVSRKRTEMTRMMCDENNLHFVKNELIALDRLCQQFQEAYNRHYEALSSPEDKEQAALHFGLKESDIFQYRKQVVDWINLCEERLSDQLDRISEARSSQRTHLSRKSRSSARTSSARAQERAKVAELLAEKSMLKKKLELQVAEKEFELDLKIAKAQARERALSEIEEEEKRKALSDGQTEFISLPEPKYSPADRRPPLLISENMGGPRAPNIKTEKQTRPLSPPIYRAFPGEIKTGIKEETPSSQKSEEELLKEVFELQHAQIQSMVSSQQQLATAVTLPQPEVPRFSGNPMKYKTFIMAFDARIQSRVASNADKLYYLDQHLIGEPKDLIGGCLHIEPDEGYVEARRLLEKEYGDPYKVSNAFLQKLLSWSIIKYEDGPALKRFSFFLTKCKNAMKTNAHMAVLNHPPNMQSVVQKLPANLQTKWRENAVKSRRKDGKIADFRDLTEFVEHAAEAANDPIYSKEALNSARTTPKPKIPLEDQKKLPPYNSKSSSFVTNVDKDPDSSVTNGTGSSRHNTTARRCPLCDKPHDLDDCESFKRKSIAERRTVLMEKSLCFGCYGRNHVSKDCKKKRECKKCKKPHPTLLHIDGFTLIKESSAAEESTDKPVKVNNACTDIPQNDNNQEIILQAIIPVLVTNKANNKALKTYAFYDNGSVGCFLTENLRHRLEAPGTKTTLQLGTMHGQSLVESIVVKDLIVTDPDGRNPIELPRAYTRDEIPVNHDQIPTPEIVSRLEHLKEIANEIPAYDRDLDIGLLIGSNCPAALVPLKVVPNMGDGPFALKLNHGWTVSGPLQVTTETSTNKVTVNRIVVREMERIKEIVTPTSLLKMFELDFNEHTSKNLPEDLGHSQEDRIFLKTVSNGIKLTSGHYQIPLPFRQSEVDLPNNREQAVKRALWQRRKMMQNDQYRNDYVAFINEILDKGYAEKVPEESVEADPGKVWYIPHHGVYHPKKPEKIRVVFDCSAKFAGTSLNDQLLQGPDLTNSLVGVLTRFRQEPVAFMGDIEAMFYQVLVPAEQRDFLRFLWWPNGDMNGTLVEYRMTVHPFGAVSSPSCSNYALRKTASENEAEVGTAAAETMRRNFYVDDCLKSVSTKAEAKDLISSLRQACGKGGFRLTKFICNERDVLETVPEEERSKDVKTLDLNYDDLPIERALGVHWCVESDTFGFRILVKDKPLTRRGILSIVSSIYDPLGFAAPFTLIAKKLLQDLCREERLGWDDQLPDCYLRRWEKWRNELPSLERLSFPRCVKPPDFREVKSRQLHIFSDASSIGYGSVVYQRLCDNQGHIHCSFLIGKARLAPIKPVTIPRLELTAATVSVRLGEMMKKELNDKPDTTQYHTDSTTVLRYIKNDQKRFQVFVANRVQLIRNHSSPDQWRYVDTKENPADDASRGLDAKTLIEQQRWLTGPEFLWQPEKAWPAQPRSLGEISTEDPEVKKQIDIFATTICDPAPIATVSKLLQHFSDWYRLKKAVAVYLRLKAVLKERRLRKNNDEPIKLSEHRTALTVRELEIAETAITRFIQSQSFEYELKILEQAGSNLKEPSRSKKNAVAVGKTSPIYRLDPFVDKGVLRVGGRLNNADIPQESKHPIILPRKSNVTTLIIRDAHERLGHAGRGHVLARLREKYWIVGANSAVRQLISSCVTCRRTKAPSQDQKMADLPKDRLTPAPPFTYVGVDYFGPFTTKQGRKEHKRYGALFTCLVSRAVHIEIANSLETDSFLNALRRFIARRGPVREIRCDNGTNFVGAERELREALKEMNHDELTEKLRQQQIDWKFNPPAASHMGGVWERQIRTVRRILATLLHEHTGRLDDESLHTLLCEVESIINSRPLTVISSDVKDPLPLSPSQILTMKTSVVLPPPGQFQHNDVYMRRRWRRVQYLCNLFWSRWKKEYLPTLQQRPKWNQPKRNMEVHDVVLIKDENVSRNDWSMGIIAKVEPDSKGFVRSAVVKTQTSELRRPVHKLVLLLAAEDRLDAADDSKDADKP